MFDNLLKPTLAVLTVGLVVGCAQPTSRLNTHAANTANANESCSTQACDLETNVVQPQVQSSRNQQNDWNQNANQNNDWNAQNNQNEKVAKAFSSNRAQRPSNNTEESTIIAGDFILTATVRALPQPNRFFTKVVIEEVDGNGDAQVIATPQLVSSFGQIGQISVAGEASGMVETNDAINVQVQIPAEDGNVNVQVRINRNGQNMTNSNVQVPMPR